MTDYSIKRGPWGKPWITRDYSPLDWPQGERYPLNAETYDRPSDIAGNLDTKENLSPYHQCQAVTGLMIGDVGKSLAVQFKALISEFGIKTWDSAKGDVKDLLRQARSNGGEEYKSGMGSALHRYSTLIDKGRDIELPEVMLGPWLDVYARAMERFEVLDWEGFVVVDDLERPGSPEDVRAAGSYDKLLRDTETGEIMVADLKTGKQDNEFAMSPTVQVALYAHGMHYDQETGRRWPIHEELSQTKGLLIHLPFNGGGDPECCIYPLDLGEGWRLAKMSRDITQARKMRAYKRDVLGRAKAPKLEPQEQEVDMGETPALSVT